METFGIFELLDALSSAPAGGAPAGGAADRLGEYSGFNAPAGGAADGFERNSGFERSSAGAAAPAAPASEAAGGLADKRTSDGSAGGGNARTGTPAPSPAPQALESFLRRHDALSKRADKKK